MNMLEKRVFNNMAKLLPSENKAIQLASIRIHNLKIFIKSTRNHDFSKVSLSNVIDELTSQVEY